MKCPRTGVPLKTIEVDGVKIEISEATGGIWLDNYELIKFDEAHESGGDELVALMQKYRNDGIDLSPRICCPHHPDMIMTRRFFSAKMEVEIDRCPMCGGVWLDAGELEKIRDLFPQASDRDVVTTQLVASVAESSDMAELLKESEEKLDKARQFSNLFRWLTPFKRD